MLAMLTACDSNSAVAPVGPPPPPSVPSGAPPALMAMQQGNVNSCTVHLNPSRASRTSTRLTLPERSRRAAPGKPLSRMQFLRWDGVSKQPSALIDCVIPQDSLAVEALKAYFLADDGAAIGQRARTAPAPNPGTTALANTFFSGMTCWYYHGSNLFDCSGVLCGYGGLEMRVGPDMADTTLFASQSQTAAMDAPSGFYMCDNGCSLWPNGMGGVGYYCPEDEGDGDDEPTGPGGGGGPSAPSSLCDPPANYANIDSLMSCNRDRSSSEDSLIAQARENYLRTDFNGDAGALLECQEMNNWLTAALAEINPVTGKQTFSTGVDNSGQTPHWGQAMAGLGHVDPRTYAAVLENPDNEGAWRRLVSTLLHEAAHGWGLRQHPNGFDSSGRYSDPYFNRLFPDSLEAGTCLR